MFLDNINCKHIIAMSVIHFNLVYNASDMYNTNIASIA